jgi:hypothetical protein
VNKCTGNTAGMKALRKDLNAAKRMRVHVGVLGNKHDRFDAQWNKEKMSNTRIGAVQEFGSIKHNIPARSWLKMPVLTRLPAEAQRIGKRFFDTIATRKGMAVALKLLGAAAERVIQQGFDTGGFGHWAKLKPRTIQRKGSSAILIDTAQLRKAVSSRVVDKSKP